MNSKITKTLFAVLSLIISILACSFPSTKSIEPQGIATDAAPTVQVAQPTETSSAPPTEIPIQHQAIPVALPADRSSHAGDYDSSTSASKKSSAGGDRFTFGRFERPFNANTMDKYFPSLDIVDTFVYQDEHGSLGLYRSKHTTPAIHSLKNMQWNSTLIEMEKGTG